MKTMKIQQSMYKSTVRPMVCLWGSTSFLLCENHPLKLRGIKPFQVVLIGTMPWWSYTPWVCGTLVFERWNYHVATFMLWVGWGIKLDANGWLILRHFACFGALLGDNMNHHCFVWWYFFSKFQLVVSDIFYVHPYTCGNDPFWLIFFKWVETTN